MGIGTERETSDFRWLGAVWVWNLLYTTFADTIAHHLGYFRQVLTLSGYSDRVKVKKAACTSLTSAQKARCVDRVYHELFVFNGFDNDS
eukprot:293893-Amphidinium_carterae.1